MKNKHAAYTIGSIPSIALLFGIAVLVLSIGADIVNNVYQRQAGNAVNLSGVGKNISGMGLQGMKQIGLYFPTIGIVLAAAIIISILVTSFAMGRQK